MRRGEYKGIIMTLNVGHVIGNGPSRDKFQKFDLNDFVIGCNLSRDEYSVDLTAVIDPGMIEYIMSNQIELPPLIVTQGVKRKINKSNWQPKVSYTFDQRAKGNSSGHFATQYLIDRGYTHIHLWGCDSYFEDTVESFTHTEAEFEQPVNQNNYKRWRNAWHEMFKQHSQIQFYIYSSNPIKERQLADPKNLSLIQL